VSYRVYRNNALLDTVSSTDWTDRASVQASPTRTRCARSTPPPTSATPPPRPVTVDVSPPVAPASLSAQWLGSPSRVELTWPAATDDLGVASYEVSRDGTVLGTTTATGVHGQRDRAGDDVLVLGRRDRRRRQPQRPRLRAGDDAGRRSRAVEALRPDRQAAEQPAPVKLSWSASTDDVGVTGYRVYREGVVIATVGFTNYTDLAVASRTRYRYAVSALDAVGNESPLSSTVKVTTK
jgi:cellulose 1,4-beta-cellobiosidase